MGKKQVIFIFATLVLISILFFLGYKTPSVQNTEGVSALSGTVQFQDLIKKETERLVPGMQARIEQLEDAQKDTNYYQTLSLLWDSLGHKTFGAYYMYQLAKTFPGESHWYIAGSKLYNAASTSSDSSMMLSCAALSHEAFENVLKTNPSNLDAKNALAILTVQIDNDVMKGVGMLKEIIAMDSNNVQALFTLGILSIRSNQMDKAIQRFQKLITIQPFNAEFYYYLAEVYAKNGQPKEAIKTYETCKTLVRDKEAQKEIDQIINQLKKL